MHRSPQPQQEKHTKRASQLRFNINIDLNYDLDVQDSLMDMYNKLGMTAEHEMKDDINYSKCFRLNRSCSPRMMHDI